MTLKPTPDELLELIQKQEVSAQKGKLKIFFGMCAGVGKTYSMLAEAHRKQHEGVQVVVGIINTHGRKETESLVVGLPIVPLMKVSYRSAVFEEFDLDAVLRLKPQLVLIDELAHTNVPGCRHKKRWQDVEELLDAGIDVYTTLNVQHIESRKDLVESIAEISIRETVPDSILERANSIEFVDIPPEELLERLKSGKVYTGELSQIAIQHFFKEDNLTALREIALRLTAEKVEHDLHGLLAMGGKGWKTREKLLVPVNASPASEELIRATRKRAFELDATWICLYVDTDIKLTEAELDRLKKYLQLARDLGAEIVNIQDIDVASAINQVIKHRDITQVIFGRSTKTNFFSRLFSKDLVEKLQKDNKNVDILILRQHRLQSLYEKIFPTMTKKEIIKSEIPSYLTSIFVIALLTFLGKFLTPSLSSHMMGFVFLLAIVGLSFFGNIGEIILAATLSTLSTSLFFTSLHSKPEIILFMLLYFVVGATVGIITTRLRKQEHNLQRREETLNRTIGIERQMSSAKDLHDLKHRMFPKLIAMIPGEYDIMTLDAWSSTLPILDNPNEQAIATWVRQNGKMAGFRTNTLSSAQGLYFPIKYRENVLGVLVYQPTPGKNLTEEEIEFLQNISYRLGVVIERFSSIEEQKGLDFTNQLEKLYQSILHSVSRSFYRPIEKIFDSVYRIKSTKDTSDDIQALFEQTANSANDLKIIIENIISISELESGRVSFEIGNHNIHDLISTCRIELFSIINQHEFVLDLPSHPPLLPFDFRLMKSALKNILINALEHSPPKAPIRILLTLQSDTYSISILDQGPGIPEELIPLIFNKFYKAPNTQSDGLGIGLAIVKSVIDLHNGSIVITPNETSGTKFTIVLPF